MSNKEYTGLQVEYISFGKDDLTTFTLPQGWTNCEVSSIEFYTTPQEGMTSQYGTCWYETDDDIELSWYGNEKKIV